MYGIAFIISMGVAGMITLLFKVVRRISSKKTSSQ